MPWRRKWQPTLVFLPGKSHGWKSLAGYIQSMRSQRVGHNWATSLSLFTEGKKAFDLMQSDSWTYIFDTCQPRKEILHLGSKEHANTSRYLELRLYSHPPWVSRLWVCGMDGQIARDYAHITTSSPVPPNLRPRGWLPQFCEPSYFLQAPQKLSPISVSLKSGSLKTNSAGIF